MLRGRINMKQNSKVKRKKLTTQWSNMYVALTLLFVLGFGFFLTSKVFVADELDILNTEIGKEYSLSTNGKFTIKDWVYDEQKNKMQVTLITSNMRNYLSELNFKSIARVNLENELPTEVVYSSNDIYIINIDNVPKQFQQVSLRLVKKDVSFIEEFEQDKATNKKEKEKLLTSIYADQRVVKKEEIIKTDVKHYAIKVTDEMIEESKNEVTKLNKNIEGETKLIDHINNEITKLKGELIYQTLEEQTETNNKIYQLEKEIETQNREIKNLQLDIQSYEAKIERLEQRKRDLEF
jgi:chromosome segregation ATPase